MWQSMPRKRANKIISALTRKGLVRPNVAFINRFRRLYRRVENPGYRVLCLGQAIFNDDVDALAAQSDKIQFIDYPRWAAKIVFQTFIPRGTKESDEYRYPLIEDTFEGAIKYNEYARRFWRLVLKTNRADAVVVANMPYCFQQELMRVCRAVGVAYIVLHKEGMAVNYSRYVNMYETQRFRGHAILFYNPLIRDAVLEKNIDGITKSNTEIVGIPRLDAYARMGPPPANRRTAVLFSFRAIDKFKHLVDDEVLMEKVVEETRNYHKEFVRLAASYPDIGFVVKTKAVGGSLDYMQEIVEEACGEWPANLVVSDKIPPQELIEQANVVTGFNSTTLIEAVVARRKVLAADFSEMLDVSESNYFDRFRTLADHVTSGDLRQSLVKALESTNDTDPAYDEERERFLHERVYKADGRSCERSNDAIIRVIESTQSAGARESAAVA